MLSVTNAYGEVIAADDAIGTLVENTDGNHLSIYGGQLSEDQSNLFHSFEQFGITAEQTADFVTDSTVQNIVGRINGGAASIIDGTLQVSGSDASLYLMNPAGMLFGLDAQLNLAGGFTATTATGIGFEESYRFEASEPGPLDYQNLTGNPETFYFDDTQAGAVVNLAELSVEAGESITLLGGSVVHTGEANASEGSITLAAVEGENLVRISQGHQLLSLEVEAATPSQANNITPASISEMLTGSGLEHATTLVTHTDGTVSLGHRNASETTLFSENGGYTAVTGGLSTQGAVGGDINVLGSNQVSLSGATLNASGDEGGGLIRVGGDYQGGGDVFTAEHTRVDADSTLLVNALSTGNGGRVIAWADDTTRFHGNIIGTGGAINGNGAFAEVSGKQHLTFTGLADLSAPNGHLGDLLLDPTNIFITDGGTSQTIGNDDYIPSTTLESQAANIFLTANNDIVIEDLSDNELTLQTGGSATFIADSNNVFGGQFIMQDLADVIRGERKEISISGAGITVGRIDTSTNAHNTGGGSITELGNVTLTSSLGVSAQAIDTFGELFSPPHHSWDGGNVTIRAANGDIDIAQTISTYSTVLPLPSGRESGNAGDISLTADNGNIFIGTGLPPTTNSILLATSAATREEAGEGGAINLSALNGEIVVSGSISTGSQVGEEEAGNGGSVNIEAGSRVVISGKVDTSSVAGDEDASNAGSVTVRASSIEIGAIDTRSKDGDDDGQSAGFVSLTGEMLVSVGSILATSTGGSDGNIFLTGDQIDLLGGDDSVAGEVVHFIPFTNTRDISLGSSSNGTLSVSTSDINAVSNSVNNILIGHQTPTGEGRLTLDQSIVSSASSRPPISIRNIEQIVGATPSDPTAETIFRLSGPGEGVIEGTGIDFANVRNLQGGSGNDIFRPEPNLLSSAFDSIQGGGGLNTISYEAFVGVPLTVDLETLLIDDIQRVIASTSNDNTLIGRDTNNLWTIDGALGTNSGRLNGTIFENFNNLRGGNADDRFSFVNGGELTGQIQGNSGSNSLDYSLYGSPIEIDLTNQTAPGILTSYSDIGSITGSSGSNDILRGADSSEVFEVDGNGSGRVVNLDDFSTLDFTNIERLDGRGGSNSLQGLAGANDWVINGMNRGLLNGNAFENFMNITGGDGSNVFAFEGVGAISGHLQGNNNIDELNYSNYSLPVTINLENMETTGVSDFSAIEVITGSTADDTLTGSNTNETFLITGPETGVVKGGTNGDLQFLNIERINGGLGDNKFVLDGLTSPSGITIEGGSDLPNGQSSNSLVSTGDNTTWRLNGNNRGILQENNISLIDFREIQNLINNSVVATEHIVRFEQTDARITGSLDSGSSDLSLVGDVISIGEPDGSGENNNGMVFGSGRLTIQPDNDNVSVFLGGKDSPEPATLDITAGEIAAIQDGFIDITIGGETNTGGITLSGDATFRDSLRLRSQADIDTRSGELTVSDGQLNIETEGAISSDRLIAQRDGITLNAGADVTVEAISSGGGQGIEITSGGSITANNTLSTVDGSASGNVLLEANNDVRVGDIITSGNSRSGDVTIRTTQGGITTGGITTANNIVVNEMTQDNAGSVSLASPGSIEVEFIDARGNGLNTGSSEIRITTDETFRATGTINNPELSNLITGENLNGSTSISTVGALMGDVRIEYGRSDLLAMKFAVGSDSTNTSAFRIETPQTAILSGSFIGSYTQENIQLINRGIAPPVTTSAETITVSGINFANSSILSESIGLRFVASGESGSSEDIFTAIETQNGRIFGEYLGIEDVPAVSIYDAQDALRKIEQTTEASPAVLYAYFVPDASSTLAVVDAQHPGESARPDDQLEIMLVTSQGEPVRRRKWGVTREQVEAANQQLRQQATSQFSTARQYLSPAQQLYDWIVRPVTDILERQNINSLGFVMDSSLRTMPVAVLHSGESFLVENYNLGILPSFSLANIHTAVNNSRVDYSQERVLAMGASEFDNQPDLPAVSAEIELISQGLGDGDAFLNEEFVLDTLQAQLGKEDYGIVHLATHAVFEPGDLQQSYIQLWDEKLSLAELGKLQLSEEEIRLMILSACSTALGDRASEYGFAGLAVSAGSEAALASIWPVNDEGTLGFMTQFYQELRETSILTAALRQTQIQMIKGEIGINDGIVYGPGGEQLADLPALAESGRWDFSHPFYWSPLTMIGNLW